MRKRKYGWTRQWFDSKAKYHYFAASTTSACGKYIMSDESMAALISREPDDKGNCPQCAKIAFRKD